jgi:long-chain acyl-CoA synthetase
MSDDGAGAVSTGTTNDQPFLNKYPEGVSWQFDVPAQPVPAILDRAVSRWPDGHMTDFLGKRLTYREVNDLVNRAAKGLQDLGVTKGTKVGLFLPNCPYHIIFYYAILRAGGTVVNYNPLYVEKELVHQIEDSHTDIIVTLDIKVLFEKMQLMLAETRLKHIIVCRMADALGGIKKLLFPIARRKDLAKIQYGSDVVKYADVISNSGAYTRVDIDPEEDVAVLQYTGGTTGVPKGAMLTHANLYLNTAQTDAWFAYREDNGGEKTLAILPFFHVYGMTAIMNFGIWRGAELILLPRFEIDNVVDVIDKQKLSLMAGVPTMYSALLHHPKSRDIDWSSFQFFSSGGAPLPVETLRAFQELTGRQICEGYGLTETSPVACAIPETGVYKAASIGLPVPGTLVEIVDMDDPSKLMPQGEKGELTISGPQVMKGYWGRPEATAESIHNGRLLTGDIGYQDEDGYTFIVDRKKEMIIASGYNVYPRHVEEAIYEHPAVEEVAVVGLPDEYRGQTVKAYIKLKDGAELTDSKLEEFLKDRLSPIQVPKIVEFRGELPKSAIGKILKKELLEEEAARNI